MQISELLIKFKNIAPPDIVIRKNTISCLNDLLHIDVDKKDITFRNGIVYIKLPPAYKNEIFINKTKILAYLEEKIGKSDLVVKDIK